MDTQAHHVGPHRRQKERGTTDEMGDQRSKSAKDIVLWKELQKNVNSIGLAHL